LRLAIAAFLIALSLLSRADAAGLFGRSEIHSADIAPFTKWDGVVARSDASSVDAGAWRTLVAELKALPLRQRVERANEVLNRVRYVAAEANWHDANHWETPSEFLARGGQCQDYAIAKFLALEQSGVPEEALRFAVVRDSLHGADHAVTIVYLDGEALVLDNQAPSVLPDTALPHYTPYYSINRLGWWYPLPAKAEPTRMARR
jgi:predicted transglutaminase-like cysteine proteinase